MIVVSFYTPQYKPEVERLIASCQQFTVEYDIVAVPDLGSWRKNVGMKPAFMLEALKKHNQPVLWIDADAEIQASVHNQVAGVPHDFGAWFIPNKYMNPQHVPDGEETKADGIASGTMYFRPTPAALGLLILWKEMETVDQGRYGQTVLGRAWRRYQEAPGLLSTWCMPQRMCKIIDMGWRDGATGPPVILHHQASRKYRHRSNRNTPRQRK